MSVIVQVLTLSWAELPVGSDSWIQAIAEAVNDEAHAVEGVVSFVVVDNHGREMWSGASPTLSIPPHHGVQFDVEIPASAFSSEPGFYWVRANCYDDLNDPKQTLIVIGGSEEAGTVQAAEHEMWEGADRHAKY